MMHYIIDDFKRNLQSDVYNLKRGGFLDGKSKENNSIMGCGFNVIG